MPYHGVRGDFLLGLVREGSAFSVEEQNGFWVLSLPQGSFRRRIALERGTRELQRRQVRRCVFPEHFPQQTWFARRGIEGVDVLPLLRKKAGEWVLAERQARGLAGSVAVFAEQLNGDVEGALHLLLKRIGSVSLPPLRGAEELQRELLRESGAVLRLLPPPRLFAAQTLLDFSRCAAAGEALTLRMGESELPCFTLPAEVAAEFPAHTNRAQLAAALWELGRLETKVIGLKSGM